VGLLPASRCCKIVCTSQELLEVFDAHACGSLFERPLEQILSQAKKHTFRSKVSPDRTTSV